MNIIKFSTNCNNKLNCKAFTSIRIHNDSKYIAGQNYDVELHHGKTSYDEMGRVRLVEKKVFKLKDLNEFMAYIDTGYSREACRKVIDTMYKNPGDEAKFDFLLFVKI